MKIITALLCLAVLGLLLAADEPISGTRRPQPHVADFFEPAQRLIIMAGKGEIQISFKDGSVTLRDVELDEAGRKFWDAVGSSFSVFRESVLRGYEARVREEQMLTVEWMEGKNIGYAFNGRRGKMGVRSDGVMVWQEVKP